MKTKLIHTEVKHDWTKCDKGTESHPFTSFNGGYKLTKEESKEAGCRNIALANLFMQSDKPFVLRESGFSGNLNGIVCRPDDYAILAKELEELEKQEEIEWQKELNGMLQ